VLLDDPATCTPGGNAGTCMLATQTDGCTGAEGGCMDTIATVLVRTTDTGFELVLDGPECLDGVGDFTLCDYELLQETSELAEACTCACTLAS